MQTTLLKTPIIDAITTSVMPCYLFTYHGHATWMPDHPRGYVRRGKGIQPPNVKMAAAYRRNQREDEALFTRSMRDSIIRTARGTESCLDAMVHGVAVEATHVHILISWKHDRPWKQMRASVRSAMTRKLNEMFGRRSWFSDSPSHKRVRDRQHFNHLVGRYLPDHSNCWIREQDAQRAAMERG